MDGQSHKWAYIHGPSLGLNLTWGSTNQHVSTVLRAQSHVILWKTYDAREPEWSACQVIPWNPGLPKDNPIDVNLRVPQGIWSTPCVEIEGWRASREHPRNQNWGPCGFLSRLEVPHPGGTVGFGWPQTPEGSLSVGPWEAPQLPGSKCSTIVHCRILCLSDTLIVYVW